MTDLLHLRPPVQGELVVFTESARNLAQEFLAGYGAGLTWLADGATIVDAEQMADLYESTRSGQPHEDATRYLDADQYLGLLAAMKKQGHGDRFEILNGDELRAEYVRDYGAQFADWGISSRVFTLYACGSFYDGLMTAVWQSIRS